VRSAAELNVGAERVSRIRLLLGKFREGFDFESSTGEAGILSPPSMLVLTYRLGTLKKVTTDTGGGGEEEEEEEEKEEGD